MQNKTFFAESLTERLIVLNEVSSTNDYLKEKSSNFTPQDEFTAIMAKHQSAGRGQRGNTFLSDPEQSLTFSFVLMPQALAVEHIFALNIVVSLGVFRWFEALGMDAAIKWPNDIILKGKKVGGVLIENVLAGSFVKRSVVGIGINFFQKQLPAEILSKATSVILAYPDFTECRLESLAVGLMAQISPVYQSWQQGESSVEELLVEYNRHLFKRGVDTSFVVDGRVVTGKIIGVQPSGLLLVEHDGPPKEYRLQEISMVI